jgi:cyclophilin family peptidyl-prolyl cis-trans isomerase
MGAGFHIPLEFPRKLSFDAPGMLGLAGTGADNGSEFFLSREALPHLDSLLPLVGRTVRGLTVLAQLESGDTLNRATILQKRGHAYDDFYQEVTKDTRVVLSRT